MSKFAVMKWRPPSPKLRATVIVFKIFYERPIDKLTRFAGHPERPIEQVRGYVLTGASEEVTFGVVNGGGGNHGDARDDPAPHEIDDDRREAGLDDMAADHERNG